MDEGNSRAHLPVFRRTLKAAAALAVLSYAAGTWLAGARLDEAAPPSRIPLASRSNIEDPVSTGSIGGGAASTRLDPCALPATRR